MNDVIISNLIKYKELKDGLISGGIDEVCIISDFDRTITKAFLPNGEFVSSVVSVLRDENILSKAYEKKAGNLFEKYHPIEINPDLSFEEKSNEMETWWKKHFDLLVDSKLKKRDLKKVAGSNRILLRDGISALIKTIEENKIPLIIFSANVLGGDSMREIFANRKVRNSIKYISNECLWDEEKLAGFKEPYIHAMNKSLTAMADGHDLLNSVNRKNAILIGDSLSDVTMTDGMNFENILKIGFLNDKVDEMIEDYKKAYDVVIINDGSTDFILNLLENIL